MKKIFLFFICLFSINFSFSQVTVKSDTIHSNIVVTFNKVKPSFDNWSIAQLKVNYVPSNKIIIMNFEVPNYNERFKTTLSDYCIIETATEEYKLLNQKEEFLMEGTMNYTFTFVIPKDSLIKIVSSDLKRITFYFVPNENFVKERLKEDRFMGDELKRHYGRVAKMTLKYKVSNPDEVQYNALMSWLKSL